MFWSLGWMTGIGLIFWSDPLCGLDMECTGLGPNWTCAELCPHLLNHMVTVAMVPWSISLVALPPCLYASDLAKLPCALWIWSITQHLPLHSVPCMCLLRPCCAPLLSPRLMQARSWVQGCVIWPMGLGNLLVRELVVLIAAASLSHPSQISGLLGNTVGWIMWLCRLGV